MKIVIIGGGPGGYVAALKAAILGAEVVLIEKKALGGTCLNQGCIPTKVFLNSADVFETIKNGSDFGINTSGNIEIKYESVYMRKVATVNQLVMGVKFLLNKRGVKVINGFASVTNDKKVQVIFANGQKEIVEADRIILAAGSVPIIPPMFKYDGVKIITSDEALKFEEAPKSMIIVGGGVIGCEFGQYLKKMGTEISIVEMADHILPLEDEDAAAVLKERFKKEKVKVYEKVKVDSVETTEQNVTAILSNGEKITADCMMVSIGRRAAIENLGLEELGIKVEKGKIVVNDKMETNVENIYAIGDIVDSPFLAHVASKEGIVAVENIMGRSKTMKYHAIPRCIYTEPEIAGVGITEADARFKNISYKIGRFNFSGIGKAMIIGQTEGFVKIIVDNTDQIIGAAVVGPHATDLLTELTLAVHLGLTAEQVGDVIHPHPTLSEAIMEALHDVHKEAVHSY